MLYSPIEDGLQASVIVPVRNGADSIEECLSSLLALDFPTADLELICVENGSSDDTPAILARMASSANRLRVIREPKRGAAAARNAGLRICQGRWVAFTDADCRVDPAWLKNLLAPLLQGETDVVGGRILGRFGANRIERFGEIIHDHRKAIQDCWPPYIISMNMAASADLLRNQGGFDERWLRGQDSELAFRLASAGMRFTYVADAIIRHRNRDTIRKLMKEAYTHGYWGASLFRQYAGLTAQAPPHPPGAPTSEARQDGLTDREVAFYSWIFGKAKRVGWLMGRRFPPTALSGPAELLRS
jgi:glycosyltransferase involved in cell wall biosynthesis